MERKSVKILQTGFVTHDVKRFVVEKPPSYKFTPGQATHVSIKSPKWKEKLHPFTFTGLNKDLVLEFTIKGYPLSRNPNHSGMTEELHKLKPGKVLLIGKPWGTINYQGKGVFIAGGAGITPFIAIFRDLHSKGKLNGNKLIFSNKTVKDIILEKELRQIFSKQNLQLTLTQEKSAGYNYGLIDEIFLKKAIKNYKQNFYVCGPPKMVSDLKEILTKLGASIESVVFEK